MHIPLKQDKLMDAVLDSPKDRFLITKNYELLSSESGKNILDARLFDTKALCVLFDELYQKDTQFYPSDIEIGVSTFTTRLYALRHFLDRNSGTLEDSKSLIYGVKALSSALSNINGNFVRIEFCPVRLLLDNGGFVAKKLSTLQVRLVLYRFCHQREISKRELIEAIAESKEKLGENFE